MAKSYKKGANKVNLEAITSVTNYLIELVHTAPGLVSGTILFLAAFIEYPLPMFPGDTIMIAGGFFAARGAISIYLVFCVLVLGSISGSIFCWFLGTIALNYKWSKKCFYFLVTTNQLQKIELWYKKYGTWIIILNRFIPGVRSAFMFAAGIVKIPLKIIVLWGSISALFWNSLLIAAGYLVSDNLEILLEWLAKYMQLLIIIFAIIAILLLLRFLFNKCIKR